LQATELADAPAAPSAASCSRIGALVTISVRRIKFAMASGCPYQGRLCQLHIRLSSLPPTRS